MSILDAFRSKPAETEAQEAEREYTTSEMNRAMAQSLANTKQQLALNAMMNAQNNALANGVGGYQISSSGNLGIGANTASSHIKTPYVDKHMGLTVTRIANGYIVALTGTDEPTYCESAADVGEFVTARMVIWGAQNERT